jgi:hypothetical protein|tara:strand:+ start:1804 stop:2208 length:405 start_codon:yes stop_codon:yes gene_type:complete
MKKKMIDSIMKFPLGDVKPKASTNFGLGGVGNPNKRVSEQFSPRQPPGVTARPESMETMGYHSMPTQRPQSRLESGLESGADAGRSIKQLDALKDMLEFLYTIPKGLLSMPMMVPRHVLQGEGLLRGSNRENGS